MKIIDCTTYYSEDLMLDVRLNILNEYVDKFIIVESKFSHSGKPKTLNFDINNFKKFKDKIDYFVIEKEPDGIDPNLENISAIKRTNSLLRIEQSYDHMINALKNVDDNDLICLSDNDEIPNFDSSHFKKSKSDIFIFKQLFFYYKFNLSLTSYDWFGTKACRLKDLSSIDELRNLKPKKYSWWRLDTFFKKDKFINIKIVDEGGWHFTELKTPKEIYMKHKNDEHHDEFDMTGITEADIEKMVKDKYIPYDHSIDKKDLKSKWGKKIRVNLTKIDDDKLPNYLIENKSKYSTWFD